jgi:hypothetical protein
MGYIVYVTDKHKGEQVELDFEDLKNFPVYFSPNFPGELSSSYTLRDDEIPETPHPVILQLSENSQNEKQSVLEEIVRRQQEHIMKLETMLRERGVPDEEIR